MEFVNTLRTRRRATASPLESFVMLLAPFAPHLAEELWEMLGHQGIVCDGGWPAFDPALRSATRSRSRSR